MKFKELKSMGNDELREKLRELEMELIKSNAQVATGTVPKSPGKIKQTKKSMAKIISIIESAESAKPTQKQTKEKTGKEEKKA